MCCRNCRDQTSFCLLWTFHSTCPQCLQWAQAHMWWPEATLTGYWTSTSYTGPHICFIPSKLLPTNVCYWKKQCMGWPALAQVGLPDQTKSPT